MSNFLFVEDAETDDRLAQAIDSREHEIHDYQISADNFRDILAGYSDLPEWPERLKQYRNASRDQIAKDLDGDDLTLTSQLAHRDQVQILLKTTEIEMKKSKKVLDVLMNRLPQSRLDEAVKRRKDAKQMTNNDGSVTVTQAQ